MSNIYEMKCKKRSEVSYEKVILELVYYYCWDAEVDERINKRYQRLWKIANLGVGKPYGRGIADIAIKKGFSLDNIKQYET